MCVVTAGNDGSVGVQTDSVISTGLDGYDLRPLRHLTLTVCVVAASYYRSVFMQTDIVTVRTAYRGKITPSEKACTLGDL